MSFQSSTLHAPSVQAEALPLGESGANRNGLSDNSCDPPDGVDGLNDLQGERVDDVS